MQADIQPTQSLPWRRIWNVMHAYHFRLQSYETCKAELQNLGLHEIQACYLLYRTARFGYELKRIY
jgi:hypothetical protein